RMTLGESIATHAGIDPMADRDPDRLRGFLLDRGVAAAAHDETWGELIDRLLSHYVEPNLVEPTFLTDYPFVLSPLARQREAGPALVERFEGFCAGMELLNGYSELNDPELQRRRFEEQAQARAEGDDEAHPVDDDCVEALSYGMAPTAGVGVGIDRVA